VPWPTRSRLLYKLANSSVGTSITWLGVVPDDYTYLLKDLVVFNQEASTRSFALWADIDGDDHVLWHAGAVGPTTTATSSGRSLVLPTGTNFGISASGAGLTGLYVSGARLGHSS
jgi:hypothetical protein